MFFGNLNNNIPAVMILRHAERFTVDNIYNHKEILLTDKGIYDSLSLGKEIKKHFTKIKIYHTPVKRCKQTAYYIALGIDADIEIEELNLLDDAGYFYKYDEIVEIIKENGPAGFAEKWCNRELSNEIIIPYDKLSMFQLNLLLDQLKQNFDLVINVVHDWNIYALLKFYFKLSIEEIGVPPYLSGIILYKNETGEICMQYSEKPDIIKLPHPGKA